MDLPPIPAHLPVLIAGPTASGKSALAMEIARRHGGVIVNADASQVYDCWRVVTARPTAEDEREVPHRLYGHQRWDAPYSAGHWLRQVAPLLTGACRPIIVGGTGLYFRALTQGMVDIPPIPPDLRARADALDLDDMIAALDSPTRGRIDLQNRARVQRAWEVLAATGQGLAAWQDETPPPLLPLASSVPLAVEAPRDWLNARIGARFDQMIAQGALHEVEAMVDRFDPSRPAFKAIGVPELVAHVTGEITLEDARNRATIATRRYAKRQRTWMRGVRADWHRVTPSIS